MAAVPVNVGHTVNCSIVYLDTNGNPMLTAPTPDSPPTWSDAPNPAGCATLTPSADGTTAADVANAAGTDTISLSVTVAGTAYTATQDVTILAAPQVLGSVQIATTVS